MRRRRYPKIHIQSKNELAKHIDSARLPYEKALSLINDVQTNFDTYWKDHPTQSKPDKRKWVRNAAGTPLARLLDLINAKVLTPADLLLPSFIFGGIGGLNHKAAVLHLLGNKRKRILLKLDITRFFEQIRHERVYHFFRDKCKCSDKGAKILADLCCVRHGPKEKPDAYKTIARGFATSSRLAVWCNVDTFLRLERLVQKELRGKDPRIAVYVDDIGITASRASKEDMLRLYVKIKTLLEQDKNQPLPLNDDKTKVIFHSGETYDKDGNYLGKWAFEHLGLQMNRNSVTIGSKTRGKLDRATSELEKSDKKDQTTKRRRGAFLNYKRYIEAE